ncbi:hypothetical protein [uncultured Maribacter sp.]|uniref:GntT/GntP/DsdX family permease n=1 Tax=uncultured Maribacter sp. TaxID=431308 RepID=UPI0034598665
MNDFTLLLSVIIGIAILLVLVIYFKIQAFISLLIASISVGLIVKLDGMQIIQVI